MGFFYNEVKAEAKKRPPAKPRGDIPIHALNQLGCSVCPRDKDTHLNTPKMEPDGDDHPLIYLLLSAPTLTDDDKGAWATDRPMRALLRLLPRDATDSMRVGGVIQCATDTQAVGKHEMECCRSRVVQDIERSRPRVILGVGDMPLAWATGHDAYAPRFRGRFLVAKVGSHVCWYYCVNYPNWALKESKYGPSDQERILAHDLEVLWSEVHDLPEPEYYGGDYDKGVVTVTGEQGASDLLGIERELEALLAEDRTAVDIETNGLRPWKLPDPKLLSVAIGTFERTVAFPLDFPDTWSKKNQRRAWELFIDFLLQSNTKECHNLAMELEWFAFLIDPKITRLTEWDDTMSMAHTIDKRPGTKALGKQTLTYFGFDLKAQSNMDTARLWTYPVKQVLRYNGMDSKWTNRLSRTLRPIIARDPKLQWSHDRKVRLASTLVLTEYRGMPADVAYAKEIGDRLNAEMRALEQRIQRCPHVIQFTKKRGRFEPTNNDQVLALMKMAGRDEVNTETRDGAKESVSEEVLSSIPAQEVPSAPLILEHRGLAKIESTYVRPLVSGNLLSQDGMIHAKYSSMTAVTDRLASEDPNAQNWPKRKFKEVRGVVRARDKRWILACDYGQIEFRVAGMASNDDNLVKYCWTGYDVHSYWAGRIVAEYPRAKDWIVSEFGVDWDEKGMKTLRQEAKNKWVFPSIFGAQVRSRAANLHLPVEVAEALDQEFWDEFPGVRKWQQRLVKFYEKHLYVETLGGNRRYGPMSLNEIINMPIQGTAAEIVTEAMMAVSERALLEDRLDDHHPMLNVHDDLSFEPYDHDLDTVIDTTVRDLCQHRFDFINVPLVVEVSVGERWSTLEEIGVYRSDELFNLRNPYKD